MEERRTDRNDVELALLDLCRKDQCSAVSYPMLIGYLYGKDILPHGMSLILEELKREGIINKKDPEGTNWEFSQSRGPLWIHVLHPTNS